MEKEKLYCKGCLAEVEGMCECGEFPLGKEYCFTQEEVDVLDSDDDYFVFQEKYIPKERGGCILFETYGEDLDEVRRQPKENVWTLIDGEGDALWIIPGMHIVNRLSYLICENPWTDESEQYQY